MIEEKLLPLHQAIDEGDINKVIPSEHKLILS